MLLSLKFWYFSSLVGLRLKLSMAFVGNADWDSKTHTHAYS